MGANERTVALRVYDHGGWALPWRVAQEEGLFASEGLTVEILQWDVSPEVLRAGTADLSTADKESKFAHGEVDVYGACEWGLIKRIAELGGGRIAGMRRDMGMPMKLFVLPIAGRAPSIADLADRPVAINQNSGSHYVALEVMEQHMARECIRLVHIGEPFARFQALMAGEVAGAFVLEPWSTLADVQGAVCLNSYPGRGGVMMSMTVPAEVRERFRRAVVRACARINAQPERYQEGLIEQLRRVGIAAPLIEQVRARLQVPRYDPPEPYTEDAFTTCYAWMRERHLVVDGIAYEQVAASAP